jgi:hypothetical protein
VRFARPRSPRAFTFTNEHTLPQTADDPTLELAPVREERTTLTDILGLGSKKRRVSPRRPPRARVTNEFALPSVIVAPEPLRSVPPPAPSSGHDLLPTRRIYRYQLSAPAPFQGDISFVLGPRTSGLLLGAIAVVAGVIMLKVMPLLGPILDALLP